jgi:hypothetical protein
MNTTRRLILTFALFASLSAANEKNGFVGPTPFHPNDVEVMILATYHMGNPGRDLHNAKIDPVTTPEKQAELEAVAVALARFKPTAIAVESVASDQSTMLDANFLKFGSSDLTTNSNETVQLGYRLAARLKLNRVYAVDEQDHEGEPSYFPYATLQQWAATHGRSTELDVIQAEVGTIAAQLEKAQRTKTVGQLLATINDPQSPYGAASHAVYMKLLGFGAGTEQPGAVLNGRWYTRNAIIFSKIRQVARPGDRIVVVFGSGHAYWLRHFIIETPQYRLVEASPFLTGL